MEIKHINKPIIENSDLSKYERTATVVTTIGLDKLGEEIPKLLTAMEKVLKDKALVYYPINDISVAPLEKIYRENMVLILKELSSTLSADKLSELFSNLEEGSFDYISPVLLLVTMLDSSVITLTDLEFRDNQALLTLSIRELTADEEREVEFLEEQHKGLRAEITKVIQDKTTAMLDEVLPSQNKHLAAELSNDLMESEPIKRTTFLAARSVSK